MKIQMYLHVPPSVSNGVLDAQTEWTFEADQSRDRVAPGWRVYGFTLDCPFIKPRVDGAVTASVPEEVTS
jgi:hypothetical protein